MATFKLGDAAKLYIGASAAALSACTLYGGVKDIELTLNADEVENDFRDNAGWHSKVPGMRECAIEFTARAKTTDTNYKIIEAAYLAGTQIRMAALLGAVSTTGSDGPKGDFSIVDYSRSEPNNEIVTTKVKAVLTEYDQWIINGVDAS
jgi:predicted secreted protein